MHTLNTLLNALAEAGRLQFAGLHYEDQTPTWSGDLWRLFGNAIGDAPENEAADRKKRRLESLCEDRGIALRFEDEIVTDESGRVHETQPGFHGQTPTWAYVGDSLWTRDEAEDDSHIDSYAEARIWRDRSHSEAGADRWGIDFGKVGFRRFDSDTQPERFETGFRVGQTDDPATVFERVQRVHGDQTEVIFAVDDVGQFDCHWFAWYRTPAMREAYEDGAAN